MTGWIILRCAPKNTVPLVRSLSASGYSGQVWTPSIQVEVRKGPSRDKVKVAEPLTPSFSFAHCCCVDDLLAEERRAVTSHPPFSVFRYMGDIPCVADSELDPLRIAESQASALSERPKFLKGQKVKTAGRGFDGMIGEVVSCEGKWSEVQFEDFPFAIKINTFLLLANGSR